MSSGNNQEGFSNISLPDFGNVDINKLAKKPSSNQPEFITTHARGREFSSLLVFSTGHFWMAGYGFGTLYGAVQGWRQAVNPNFKVRLNAVMNGASSNAAKIGNPLGVLGKNINIYDMESITAYLFLFIIYFHFILFLLIFIYN